MTLQALAMHIIRRTVNNNQTAQALNLRYYASEGASSPGDRQLIKTHSVAGGVRVCKSCALSELRYI